MIQQLRLDGFLSFAPGSEAIDLKPLNVLIGPNGSGKSNLIEAIGLLAATPRDLAGAVRRGGGATEWIWKGRPAADHMTIEAVINPAHTTTRRALRYRLSLASVRRRLELVDEAVEETEAVSGKPDVFFYYRFQQGNPVLSARTTDGAQAQRGLRREDLIPDQSVLSQRRDPDTYPEITRLGREFANIRMFREWMWGRKAPPRQPQQADSPEDHLLPDASNLTLVLNRLEHLGNGKIADALARFFPRFERLSTPVSGGAVDLYMHESEFSSPVPVTRLSEGTLRFLALLAALHSPSPPALLCIEEPELGLHPDAVLLVAQMLVEASKRMQIIVTTHSPSLVTALTDEPDSVIACERLGDRTVLERLDPGRLADWLEDYTLGDLWLMGELGANP